MIFIKQFDRFFTHKSSIFKTGANKNPGVLTIRKQIIELMVQNLIK